MVNFSQEIGLPNHERWTEGPGSMLTLYTVFSRSVLTDSSLNFAYRRYPTLPDAMAPVAQIREEPIIDIYKQIYHSNHLPMSHIVPDLWREHLDLA